MPPFLIDITRLLDRALQGKRPTGVDRVGLAYLGYFRQRSQALLRLAGRWVVFKQAESQQIFEWLMAPEGKSAASLRWLAGRNYALNWQLPPAGSILLNVVHSGLDRREYGERVRCHGLRPLYFLHDLIPINFPEYVRPGEAVRHQRRLSTMLSTARGLVVNSMMTGRELDAYAAALGVSTPPWRVAYLAPPVFPRPVAERPMASPYFVVLGTIEPRKNHLLLLNLWRDLAIRLGQAAPHLVIIGQRGWECEQVVDMLERSTVLQGVVLEIPNCDDVALATWLSHAQALLFPSFAEGYGIPLVEALSLGVPVIASNLPVFRELAGDVPEYLDPMDGLGWSQAILDYSSNDHIRRKEQIRRMSRWQPPTWDEHFAIVESFMAQVLA